MNGGWWVVKGGRGLNGFDGDAELGVLPIANQVTNTEPI